MMKTKMFLIIQLLVIGLIITTTNSCKKDDPIKKDVVITWANPADITIGTALSATQLNAAVDVPGTFVYTPAIGTVLSTGTAQNLKVDFTPTDAVNNNAATKTVTINVIAKQDPIITWANPADIIEGTALSATQLNATADVAGTFVYTPASGTVLSVGANQNLQVDFTPTDAVNYNNATKTVTINVTNVFTDPRDGNVYHTVTIGTQVWMVENLRYLPSVVGPGTGSQTVQYYYVYGYNGTVVADAKATTNYTTYGVLYNWTAAMDGEASSITNPSGIQGVCPTGWHLPSDAEWTQMENYLADNGHNYDGTTGGGGAKIAKSLASTSGWNSSSNTGAVGNTDFPTYRNKSGFTALPGGGRDDDGGGVFDGIGGNGFWWSATEGFASRAWYRYMGRGNSYVFRGDVTEELGFSVRCMRD